MSDIEEWPKKGGNGTASLSGWSVEARSIAFPRKIGDVIYTDKWSRVHFADAPIGVPRGPDYYQPILVMTGLHSYQSAQALRWWFLAEMDRQHSLSFQTRLVKHEIKHSYTVTAVSAHVQIGGEDRSDIMPDWGVKQPELAPSPPEKSQ